MTEEFEEDVFGEMDDIRGDNRVAVPDVGHIRRRVARQQRAAGLTLAALLLAGLGGFWATRPGGVEVATADDATADDATPVEGASPVAADSAPVELREDVRLSSETLGIWLEARGRSVRVAAVSDDATIRGVKIGLTSHVVGESLEYLAFVHAECGPLLRYGMIEVGDSSATFLNGQAPALTDVVFDGEAYECEPPKPQRLYDILFGDFQISATPNGLRLSNRDDQIDFVFIDANDEPITADSPGSTIPSDATASPWVLRNPTVDPSSNVVDILVSDQSGCTSGRRADDRISYELDLTQTEVFITALTTALEGGQNCPSNPFTPLTIALGEPVGDRALIDGSGKVVDQYEDYSVPPGPLFRLSTEPPRPPITPATTVTSESMFYIEARCEVAEDSFEDRFATGWTPDGVFADPDQVIASAVAGYGLSTDGWHVVESTDGFGQTTRNWTQYLDGVPKASLLVGPAMLGWGTAGAVCDLDGSWVPDSEPPADRAVMLLTGPTSELADVNSVLEQVESLSHDSDGWSFLDESRRCDTWIEVEKALEQTDHVIQSRYEVETIGQSETWQVRMSVVNEIGELAVLSTSGQGQVTVSPSPLPKLSPPRGLPWESGLGPCWLDSPISPDRE